LETAGRYWAAVRVRGMRTISNALSIGREFDLLGAGTFEFARSQGWCKRAEDFDFAACFGDAKYALASGGHVRRACTHAWLQRRAGQLQPADFIAALCDHAGHEVADGWRMVMPCAHAAWWPTRQAGQTTGSMVSELRTDGLSTHWLTGTSSPCLSWFKPVQLGGQLLDAGPRPQGRADRDSLFWRHERLHRLALADYAQRSAWLAEQGTWRPGQVENCQSQWREHREALPALTARLASQARKPEKKVSLFSFRGQRYWREQNLLDGLT
jgi:dipeptidase